jgi:hypothetical protein
MVFIFGFNDSVWVNAIQDKSATFSWIPSLTQMLVPDIVPGNTNTLVSG